MNSALMILRKRCWNIEASLNDPGDSNDSRCLEVAEPMLIQVSDEQLLKPVSSIFINPLRGIRSIMEFESPGLKIRIRTPREEWMKAELRRHDDRQERGNR